MEELESMEVTPSEEVTQKSQSVKPSEIRHESQILYKRGEHKKTMECIVMMLAARFQPFYGEFVTFMNQMESTNLPTLGVNVNKNGMNLFWNRKFIDGLENSELLFILIHECFHLLFDHTKRSIFYNHNLSNIVQDMIINQIIYTDVVLQLEKDFEKEKMRWRAEKPSDFIKIPTDNNEFILDEHGKPMLDDSGNQIKNPRFGQNTALFVPKEYTGVLAFEDLYEWFKNEQQKYKERIEKQDSKKTDKDCDNQGNGKGKGHQGKGQNGQSGQGGQSGTGQKGQGGSGEEDGDGQGEPSQGNGKGKGKPQLDSAGNPSYGKYGQDGVECSSLDSLFDSLEKGEQLTLDSHIQDEVQGDARKSVVNDFVQRLKNRGLMSADVEATLNKLRKSKKDYLKEIKRCISNNIIGTTKIKTITRPNRRSIEGIKGKKKIKNMVNCILDTSGSMGGDFERVLSYVFQNDIQLNLIQIDTEVKNVNIIKNKKDLQQMNICGLGGTVLQPAIDFIADSKNKLSKFNTIILTDGYTDTLNFSQIGTKTLILTTAIKPTIVDLKGKTKCIVIDKEESLHNKNK